MTEIVYVNGTLATVQSKGLPFDSWISYNISPELLNQALFNITLSLITDFGWWWANDTEVLKWETINIYTFSKPLSLLIPYFLCLFIALPILAMGGYALRQNGVSAVDGGFIQLITTSTGSPTLQKLAAGGCLGGFESIPKELKQLEIRFGELVNEGKEEGVRRAGFGTEKETVPLTKGVLYGGEY